MSQPPPNFNAAFIIVDLQEDFCPPNGSLAVPNGRDIIPTINHLLTLPFTLKIATKDWHPVDHISFANNHTKKQAFVDTVTIVNPANPVEKVESRLWPVHCVQNTHGAELVPELDISRVDKIIEKGTRKDVEMYSAFYDPFETRVVDSGLATVLREKGIRDVFVVGLAGDYCVKATAVDSKKEGFRTWVVSEGTRCVDQSCWDEVRREFKERGVDVVGVDGVEVGWIRGSMD